jgi:predicted ferric reductase
MSESIIPEKKSTLETELDHSTNPFLLGVMAIVAGLLLSGIILPFILPGLISSLLGPEPKVYWYLSRSSAIISYLMLWASMVFGLLLSSRSAKLWPGGFTANDLHQFLSIAGLTAGLFHGLILMGDHYMNVSLVQVLLPFATIDYRPEWVGIGQLLFYIWGGLVFSFYIRKKIGTKAWRTIHYTGFLAFAGALVHGVTSGTDTNTLWMSVIYWVSGASVLFLTFYRVFASGETAAARRVIPVNASTSIES